jgi:hypothetical protein
MVPKARAEFLAGWSEAQYAALLDRLHTYLGVPIEFRISETPCFFPAALMHQLVLNAHTLVDQLLDNPDYRRAADVIVPDRFRVAHGEDLPTCIQVDFGLVRQPDGSVEGRLVELQAFPSLYGFQALLASESTTTNVSSGHRFLGGLDGASYRELMRRVLVEPHDPQEVVLMEIQPERQKTRPDFIVTERVWGIRAVDTSAVRRDGRALFYERDGEWIRIKRIYNRVIPDELERSGAVMPFDYREDLDVEWIGGPDWYFRISKYSIPWLNHAWVPETHYLSDVTTLPTDREEWLLKPLFSFAGGGILFAPTDADIAAIPVDQRHLYILQRKVRFTPMIETPHGPTQAELRIMMVRDPDAVPGGPRYRAVLPLVRMGRGKMMGVDHNKGLAFVGASAAVMID